MAYGNNRSGEQPRAHFQLVGGTIIKFKHPYLAGQISANGNIDEIDISGSLKLEGRLFDANPNQDSAKQVVLVDGSVMTITNKLLNGTLTLPVIKKTGLVSTGDFLASLQLIKSVGDTVGGLIIKTEFLDGKAITRVYYGVTPQRVPDDRLEGNDVAVYDCQLFYAGWLEASSTNSNENLKKIWAVGTEKGLEGFYTPYKAQNSDGTSGSKDTYMQSANLGITNAEANDSNSADKAGTALTKGSQYVDTATAVTADGTIKVQEVGDGIPTA